EVRAVELDGKKITQSLGKMERAPLRHILDVTQEFLGAGPSDLDAAEQIGLRARHLEDALGLEMRLGSKNLRVRAETHLGAAAIGCPADLLKLAFRLAALERHPIERLLARDLDLEPLGQGIGHGDADPVETARRVVDLGLELSAGV